MSHRLPVIFRTWPKSKGGDTIALFPTVPEDAHGRFCMSYQHIGQHGGADMGFVATVARQATRAEAAELRRELEAAPYHYRLKRYYRESPAMRKARRDEAARLWSA